MPATIRNKTLASITEQGVKLENAQIFRKLKNNDWNSIQIGLRMIMDDSTGANPSAGSVFGFGLCSGNTNGLGSLVRGHIVFASTYLTTGAAGGFVGSSEGTDGNWRGVSSSGGSSAKFVNDVFTSGGAWSGIVGTLYFLMEPAATATNFWNTCFYLRITKGTPNWSILPIFNGSSTLANRTRAQWLSFAESNGAASSAPIGYNYSAATRTIAVDEATDGVLDHVNVWWNRSAPSILITDISIARLA